MAYNAAFDKRLLAQTHLRHGLTTPQLITDCAMQLFAAWDRARDSWKWWKLIEAASACAVWEEGARRAPADARMTLGQRRTSGRRPTPQALGRMISISAAPSESSALPTR